MEPLTRLATYPFMPEAQEWIKTRGPSLDELLKDRAYAAARTMAKKRLLQALEKDRKWRSTYDTDPESINELLSYIGARLLASVVGDPYLIRRYSLSEAERINHMLINESMDFIIRICGILDVEVSSVPMVDDAAAQARMHFLTFLKNTSQMRAKEWKLVNMNVKEGFVLLDKRRICRILQEVLRRKFEDELPLGINEAISEALEAPTLEILEVIEEKKKLFEPDGLGEIKAENFPPCLIALIARAQKGENISHMGRFSIASFLHTIGMSNEEILKIFSVSPDFREDLAMYQIEHVTGVISGTEYTPPECTTMVTFGLCVNKDRLCEKDWMNHPLNYYRSSLRYHRRQNGKAKVEKDHDGKAEEED